MLIGVIQDHHLGGAEIHESADACGAVIAYGYVKVRETALDLEGLVTYEAAVGPCIGHEETLGVTFVATAQYGCDETLLEESRGVFGMRGLACSANRYVSYRYDRDGERGALS